MENYKNMENDKLIWIKNIAELKEDLKKLEKDEIIDVICKYCDDLYKNLATKYWKGTSCTCAKILNSFESNDIYRLKELVFYIVDINKKYNDWIQLRDKSIDLYNEKLCYCGHTYKCSCGNPNKNEFETALENGNIKLQDPDNGWKVMSESLDDKNLHIAYRKMYENYMKNVTDTFINMQTNPDEWFDATQHQKESVEYLEKHSLTFSEWFKKFKHRKNE